MFETRSKSDTNLTFSYNYNCFVDTDKLFSSRNSQRDKLTPMDIDITETTTSWLKLNPKNDGEPSRKRPFFGNSSSKTEEKDSNEPSESKNIGFGVGAPFLFQTPIKMDKIRDISQENLEFDLSKPSFRSQDSKPISLKYAKKVSKERGLIIKKNQQDFEEKAHKNSKSTTKNLEIDKLQITPRRKNNKSIILDSSGQSESSDYSDFDSAIFSNSISKRFSNSAKSETKNFKRSVNYKKYNNILSSNSDFVSAQRNLQVHKDIPFVVSG
ncbi:hypothetical protein AYI68_g6788 [Smittium mucronatum]|uniref:Uncharacterized protein n=1 Tax=Smittium mucronatum TaxID=133383 RepID=A0A1R0GQH8_9FUNG|nr:hypothetical protein AYI68_g6788 [Smittium mucronatum]